jgi:hypothetical protein
MGADRPDHVAEARLTTGAFFNLECGDLRPFGIFSSRAWTHVGGWQGKGCHPEKNTKAAKIAALQMEKGPLQGDCSWLDHQPLH